MCIACGKALALGRNAEPCLCNFCRLRLGLIEQPSLINSDREIIRECVVLYTHAHPKPCRPHTFILRVRIIYALNTHPRYVSAYAISSRSGRSDIPDFPYTLIHRQRKRGAPSPKKQVGGASPPTITFGAFS